MVLGCQMAACSEFWMAKSFEVLGLKKLIMCSFRELPREVYIGPVRGGLYRVNYREIGSMVDAGNETKLKLFQIVMVTRAVSKVCQWLSSYCLDDRWYPWKTLSVIVCVMLRSRLA